VVLERFHGMASFGRSQGCLEYFVRTHFSFSLNRFSGAAPKQLAERAGKDNEIVDFPPLFG
jgi:hypothetical protein